ncbi:unnamed protein product [Caenorhabditis sp. 36 PRJEB53466]|nr:unnamed protein product [Caenorhabditis sp. 36 PRJEB53466]
MSEEDAIQHLNAATTIAKEMLDVGMYSAKKCIPAIAVFVELGLIARTVAGFATPGKKDKVLEEIAALSEKFGKIEESIKENFLNLKLFMSAHSFFNDVPLATSVLFESMLKALTKPGKDSENDFRDQYAITQPLEYSRRLNHQLLYATMNPMRWAMANEAVKSTKVFEEWKNIFESVLVQLCILEAFACGLINGKDTFKVEATVKEYNTFKKRVKQWKKQYQTENQFWPHAVKKVVDEVQDNSANKTIEEKAELIRTGIEPILTDSIFYVIVMPESFTTRHHANLPDQVFISLNRGGCHVFVYRSLKAIAEAEGIRLFNTVVDYFQKMRMPEYSKWVEWLGQNELRRMTLALLRKSGIVLIVENAKKGDVAVRCTKTNILENGPGKWFYRSRTHDKETSCFFLTGFN